jgi:hypothetical protein
VLCHASLVFVGYGEDRHQEHTRCDEVPGLEHREYVGGGHYYPLLL